MREPMRDPGRLEDILDASMLIVDSTSNITYEQFLRERLKYFGIIKNVEIIGEAAYMLTPGFRSAHPEVPWDEMIKMRHVLVHGYASILPEILWDTCRNDIPSIIPPIQTILDSFNRLGDCKI